jgi:hypothetical protein
LINKKKPVEGKEKRGRITATIMVHKRREGCCSSKCAFLLRSGLAGPGECRLELWLNRSSNLVPTNFSEGNLTVFKRCQRCLQLFK